MDEKTTMHREVFAVKACHMLGMTIDEASKVLAMDTEHVRLLFTLIEDDWIDFEAMIDD